MMHLTCTNMPRESILDALEKAKAAGIRNILALRGDPPKGSDTWEKCDNGFTYAADLVKFIRAQYGDFFGIAVAGYPECHMSSSSKEADIAHLKEKVDAGADFVITQLFFDCDIFLDFVARCRAVGITVPIIPGIMPIQSYDGFCRMTGFCKTFVPQRILDKLEPIKHDDAAVKSFGVELAVEMCQYLSQRGVQGMHFYTLNLERSVFRILEGLGYITLDGERHKQVPWVPSKLKSRQKEEVRPIFWANRPSSYLSRTSTWDDFPNGRWGDARSPAFGDLSDYHLCSLSTGPKADRIAKWGSEITSVQSVYDVFARYINGEIPRLPWCETPVHLETLPLKVKLVAINRAGFLTINSQPRVNGAPSTDSAVGWGMPDGFVYQKAYLEFFVAPSNLERLKVEFAKFPMMSFHAANRKGDIVTNQRTDKGVNAVTWGVFPDKEIIQPTVVDPVSFMVWKDEAFALWSSQWQSIYEPNSPSFKLLQEVVDSFWLVNVVDNNYVNGDIFALFEELIK